MFQRRGNHILKGATIKGQNILTMRINIILKVIKIRDH